MLVSISLIHLLSHILDGSIGRHSLGCDFLSILFILDDSTPQLAGRDLGPRVIPERMTMMISTMLLLAMMTLGRVPLLDRRSP